MVRNAAAVVLAPSTASGTQKCIGTEPALKSSPSTTSTTPATAAAVGASRTLPRSEYAVVPVSPASTAAPSINQMPASAPSR